MRRSAGLAQQRLVGTADVSQSLSVNLLPVPCVSQNRSTELFSTLLSVTVLLFPGAPKAATRMPPVPMVALVPALLPSTELSRTVVNEALRTAIPMPDVGGGGGGLAPGHALLFRSTSFPWTSQWLLAGPAPVSRM